MTLWHQPSPSPSAASEGLLGQNKLARRFGLTMRCISSTKRATRPRPHWGHRTSAVLTSGYISLFPRRRATTARSTRWATRSITRSCMNDRSKTPASRRFTTSASPVIT